MTEPELVAIIKKLVMAELVRDGVIDFDVDTVPLDVADLSELVAKGVDVEG